MACPCAVELVWRSHQESKHPHNSGTWHIPSNTLTGSSRTHWLVQNPEHLFHLNRDKYGYDAHRKCGPFSLNSKALCSRVIARAVSSRIGFLFQNPGGNICLSLQENAKRRAVVQAERSKPHQRRRVKRPSGGQPDPAGNIRKKKPDHSKPPEPYVRHPDDYYKFGPYGPYAYKAGVVGTLIPVTSFDQDYVFTWSSIKDLKEQEQVDIHDACVLYHNRVQTFDASVLQFFYVFARLPFHIGPEPFWKQWTLVAEIAVESGESLDKLSLISRLSDPIRNRISTYTGWFRPDLIYVKKKRRRYQVRFESEKDFLRELERLLMQSVGEPNEKDSYYGQFCEILGLDVNASHETMISRYEESSEVIRLACVEHLLSKHPVQLLDYMPYPNRAVWTTKESSSEVKKTSDGEALMPTTPRAHMGNEEEESNAVHYFEDEGPSESDEDEYIDEESEDWDDLDDPTIHSKMSASFSKLKDKELAMLHQQAADDDESDITDSEDNNHARKEGDAYAGDLGVSDSCRPDGDSILRAAVRPYTYVNLIREMAMLREMFLREKRQMQQHEAGKT